MKTTRTLFVVAIVLFVFVSGCVTRHVIDISAAGASEGSPRDNGLTATSAVELFRGLADELGTTIEGPLPQPRGAQSLQYVMRRNGKGPESHPDVTMFTTKKGVIFYIYFFGNGKPRETAENFARRVKERLDKLHVPYRETRRSANPLNN